MNLYWLTHSFLSFEFYTAEMLVFLCLRISASSIWNFSRFGVLYWYVYNSLHGVQSTVSLSITRRHSCHQQPTLSCNIGQGFPWRHPPPTTVCVAVVLGYTVDAKRLQPVQWRHQPAVLRKSPQYSVTGTLSITITKSISCFPGDGMGVYHSTESCSTQSVNVPVWHCASSSPYCCC